MGMFGGSSARQRYAGPVQRRGYAVGASTQADVRKDLVAGYYNALALERQLAEARNAYAAGPGLTKGIMGLSDYIGTPSMSLFNEAGNAMRGPVASAMGFTASQNNTEKESQRNVGAFIPQSGDYDSSIQAKLARIQDLVNAAKQRSISQLGGIPDQNGNVRPVQTSGNMTAASSGPGGPPPAGAGVPPAPPLAGPPSPAGASIATGGGMRNEPIPLYNVSPDQASSLATGPTRTVRERTPLMDSVAQLVNSGASAHQVRAFLNSSGVNLSTVSGIDAAVKFHKRYPNTKSDAYYNRIVPTTPLNQFMSSGKGVALGAFADTALAGLTDEFTGGINSLIAGEPLRQSIDAANASKQVAFEANPGAALAGGVAGNIAGTAFTGGLLKGAGLAGKHAPLASEIGFNAATGAGQSNDNRLLGAGIGAGLGIAGRYAGEAAAVPIGALARTRPLAASVDFARGMFGANPLNRVPALTPAQQAAVAAINKAGPDGLKTSLAEAADLKLPMTIADTHPEPRELVGAAVRRSPTASKVAEDVLLRREREQVERFGSAVERDLGPTGNVPKLSAALDKEAEAKAGPLYRKANPQQVDDPQLERLLQHPQLQDAYERAQELHANDVALAIARGEEPPPPRKGIFRPKSQPGPIGDPKIDEMLKPVKWGHEDAFANPKAFETYRPPDIRTIDYIQRGLRAKIDAAYAGDAQAKLHLPFLKGARKLLLERADAHVGDYKAARGAWGGMKDAQEALELGRAGVSMKPHDLEFEIEGLSPAQMAQARLGHRSGLLEAGNDVRFRSNPYDVLDGTQNRVDRLGVMFNGDPSTNLPRLLRQAELERGMQDTSNAILGNSKTAQRQIADAAFANDDTVGQLVDAGVNMAMGQVPTGVVLKGLGSQRLKDWVKFGVGKRAVAKADGLAPLLLNPDAAANVNTIDDLINGAALRRAYIGQSRPTRALGMFGRGLGVAATRYFTN